MLVLASCCYGCLEQERIPLLQVKASINNPNGNSLPSWQEGLVGEESNNCCEREGVKCNTKTGQLQTLDLSLNSLVGCVENEGFERLEQLSNPEVLDLGRNNFNNSILSTLGRLKSLKSLYLNYNKLRGSIHIDDFKGFENLEVLDVTSNELHSIIVYPGMRTRMLEY
ncbi:hypothetical protein F0562_009163 [Nyssa sinensis]|uniref:Leucine-rich repeat-containing N-terminal plant-type domain-containing protein n=1 Tax=Nyssa sinensis TaxID=561372 RepID=A0A5J4ZVA0_9ASTE|nr:hypothetical protein F0562_009163 [Nyssa sinensis]